MKILFKIVPWLAAAVFAAEIIAVMAPKKESEFHVREFGRLPGVLILKRVIEIVVLRAGHELVEHGLAVGRESEFFDKADFIFRAPAEGCEQYSDSEDESQACFHRGKQELNEVRANRGPIPSLVQ